MSVNNSTGKNFPLIYCNGDSYSDENYHSSLIEQTYAHVVGRHFNGFVINRAISGSCNRRIVRTSCHDLIHQRQLNPGQQIIALLGLSFELRSEIWMEEHINLIPEESNFVTHVFARTLSWKDKLLKTGKLEEKVFISNQIDNKFLDKYSHGRAYFYSPYAERINLLCDLVMFQALMKTLDIKFLIFQSPVAEKLENEYLVDFFKQQLNPNSFIDLESFGFASWCATKKFKPLDLQECPEIAHYSADAHAAFAEQILIPRLQ